MADYSYLNNVPACRIHKCNAEQIHEESLDLQSLIRRKLLSFACATPRDNPNDSGMIWEEYVLHEVDDLMDDFEESVIRNFLAEYIMEYPEDVDDELERRDVSNEGQLELHLDEAFGKATSSTNHDSVRWYHDGDGVLRSTKIKEGSEEE